MVLGIAVVTFDFSFGTQFDISMVLVLLLLCFDSIVGRERLGTLFFAHGSWGLLL